MNSKNGRTHRLFSWVTTAVLTLASLLIFTACPPQIKPGTPAFAVTFSVEGKNGTLTAKVGDTPINTDTKIEKGKTVTFTAIPAENYIIDKWIITGGSFETDPNTNGSTVAKIKVSGTTEVKVSFKAKPVTAYTVTFSAGANGSLNVKVDDIVINSSVKVAKDKIVVFTATPASNYTIESWTVNGAVIAGNTANTYRHTVTANADIKVSFKSSQTQPEPAPQPTEKFAVTFSAGENGSLSATVDGAVISAGAEVEKGKTVTFTATAAQLYEVEKWTNGSADISEAGTNDVYNYTVTAKADIKVKFKYTGRSRYTVKHYQEKAEGGYPAEPAHAESLKGMEGENAAYTPKTYEGFTYKPNLTKVNGAVQTSGTINADGSTVVELYYDRKEITLTINLDGGTLNPPLAENKVKGRFGATVPPVADPTKKGRTFEGWNPALPEKFPAQDSTYTAQWHLPVFVKEDGVTVETENGVSVTYTDLKTVKKLYPDTTLNTRNIAVQVETLTPALVNDFFKNFTHLNIDVSEEIQVTSNDTQDPDADGNLQYFKAADLSEVSDRINFVDNSSGSMNPFKTFQFENIKGNIVISDTFSRFKDRELEAFVKNDYTLHDGTEIPRTKTWVTFSQLTKLIRWLKKYEFFNNKVRFGDMLVAKKNGWERDKDVLNCLNTMISENIERFELKNTPGEEYSIKFAGYYSIDCHMILNGSAPNTEINVNQLLQISKRCRWKRLDRHDDGTVSDDIRPESMALRFNIKNLNCKKLSADELKDLSFKNAWFGASFEGEDTDLSEISFEGAHNGGAGLVSFTGIFPKNHWEAHYDYLIIRDAEIPDINESDIPYDPEYTEEKMKRWIDIKRLPGIVRHLIVHNLKGLDKIAKGLTKEEVGDQYGGWIYSNTPIFRIATMYIGSEEAYKEFNRLYAFFYNMHFFYDDHAGFVCFTDKNNTVLKGPYKRMPDKGTYLEDGELIPVPLGNYKQDENGFFEKK